LEATPTTAILPVKRVGEAKQRLGAALDPTARAALAPAMVADVVAALRETKLLDALLVVSSEPVAARLAREANASLVAEPGEPGQSAATRAGMRRAAELGFARALLVPGDCPLIAPAEVDALLERAAERALDVAIVPDRHEEGTNALLLDPAGDFLPAFGPGSLARHTEQAERLGLRHSIERVPSLALDIDTPEDLEALVAALGAGTPAPHTQAALAELGRAPQPPVRT
jgi:2-phospho-L-lactate guanylyltransferase